MRFGERRHKRRDVDGVTDGLVARRIDDVAQHLTKQTNTLQLILLFFLSLLFYIVTIIIIILYYHYYHHHFTLVLSSSLFYINIIIHS